MTRRSSVLAVVVMVTATPTAPGQEQVLRERDGKVTIEDWGYLRRLHHNNVLFGTQFHTNYLVRADGAIPFGLFTPWEATATVGMLGWWDATQEPLNYYHRTGPVGAVFTHFRGRASGTPASIGVVGLNTGSLAAYARRGESVTFYESRPELKGLIADSDRHFTFLRDARARGATVDVRFGPARKSLAADADRRFSVLFVEQYETGFDPGDLLTFEAVRLYADRISPDGIVALHVSNKDYRLEPVAARIARELKLVGRVWHSEAGRQPIRSACSWVVLARTEAAPGWLGGATTKQTRAFGVQNEVLGDLLRKYADDDGALAAIRSEWLGSAADGEPPTGWEVPVRHGPQAAALYHYALRLRDDGEPDATLARLAERVCGRMFQPFVACDVPLRTDARRPDLLGANDRTNWPAGLFLAFPAYPI